jgi:hypothetical protein
MCRQEVRKLEVAIDRVKFTKKVVYWSIKLNTTRSLSISYHAP